MKLTIIENNPKNPTRNSIDNGVLFSYKTEPGVVWLAGDYSDDKKDIDPFQGDVFEIYDFEKNAEVIIQGRIAHA